MAKKYGNTFAHQDSAFVPHAILLGKTAKQWGGENPDKAVNLPTMPMQCQLVCLANLENLNPVWSEEDLQQANRL